MCQSSNENMGAGNFSCCESKTFVQDKVCNNFTVAANDVVGAEILYATNANDVIFASGFIKNTGNFPLIVQFVKGANPLSGADGIIVRQTIVPSGGAFTFTVSRFDTIRAFATGATVLLPAAGEFCITPRYEIG